MPEAKPKRKPKRQQKRTYVSRSNAVHITIYSQDGKPVPTAVLNEAAQAVTDLALSHRLLVGLAET